MTPTLIVETAREYLGSPWRHQGRTLHGIDCGGLILGVGKTLNLLPADLEVSGYSRRASGFDFLIPFRNHMDMVPVASISEGQVLVVADGPYPCHVGIVSIKYDQLHFIHAYAGLKKVVETPLAPWMSKATHAFSYRVK